MNAQKPRPGSQRNFPSGAELLKDPFSEPTRRHRRALVTVSSLAILITVTGWYPTQLSAAGLTLSAADRVTLLWVLAATVLYLLISFISYVWPEQMYANAAVWVWTDAAKDEPGVPWQIALVSFMARYTVDLILPLLIATIALVCLLWVAIAPSSADTLAAVVTWIARILAVLALAVAVFMMGGLFAEIVSDVFRRNVRRLRDLASRRRST